MKDETKGLKYDDGKLRWSLLPLGPIREIIRVLEFGAKKYGENNWQKLDNGRTRYYEALLRHITAWFEGEVNDPESGLHHLAHAGCCLLFLLWSDKK